MSSNYQKLIAWQKATELCEIVYKIVQYFPRSEEVALGDQLRRSAMSVVSNIAEGLRMTIKSFIHYLNIAHASAAEVEAQLFMAGKLFPVPAPLIHQALDQADHTSRMIFLLRKGLIDLHNRTPHRRS